MQAPTACCPTSTSPSTARCSRRGRVTRASADATTPPDAPDDPENPTVNFHGETRRNDTHQSTTDPDARLYKKASGREAKLAYLGHLLTENRHGLIVDAVVTAASGTAERDAALLMLGELPDGVASPSAATRSTTRAPGCATSARWASRRTSRSTGDRAPRQRHRRAHHPASRLRAQSTETETRRASLRLDEDRRPAAQAPASRRAARRLDLDLRRGGVQPGPLAHAAGEARVMANDPERTGNIAMNSASYSRTSRRLGSHFFSGLRESLVLQLFGSAATAREHQRERNEPKDRQSIAVREKAAT